MRVREGILQNKNRKFLKFYYKLKILKKSLYRILVDLDLFENFKSLPNDFAALSFP